MKREAWGGIKAPSECWLESWGGLSAEGFGGFCGREEKPGY
jgi:hypothetical protein